MQFKRNFRILNFNNIKKKKKKNPHNIDLNADNIESIEYFYDDKQTEDEEFTVSSVKITMVSGNVFHHSYEPSKRESLAVVESQNGDYLIE